MAAAKKKAAKKETEAVVEAQEESAPITVVDTFFKTQRLTFDPDDIMGFEHNNTTSIKIHLRNDKVITTILGEDEELEILTNRWAEALYNKSVFGLQQLEAEQAIFKTNAATPEIPEG